MSNIYKTWELLKMVDEMEVVDNGKKFRCISVGLNKDKIVEFAQVSVKDGKKGLKIKDGFQIGKDIACTNDEWELIQKSVTFIEAVESKKKMRVEHYLIENDPFFKNYHTLQEVLHRGLTPDCNSVTIRDIILNGKWYVED